LAGDEAHEGNVYYMYDSFPVQVINAAYMYDKMANNYQCNCEPNIKLLTK